RFPIPRRPYTVHGRAVAGGGCLMAWHVFKRILQSIPLLLGIATILFVVAHLAPGDPVEMYLQKRAEKSASGRPFDPRLEQLIRQKYGLDRPLPVQYAMWLSNLARGDLGESFQYHRPVSKIIAERLPYTLQLTVLALVLGGIIGIAIGIASAVRQHSAFDKAVSLGSLLLYSIPEFWVAVMFILLFSVTLRWLPISQTRSLDYLLYSPLAQFFDRLWHLILPVTVLALGSAAGTARYMRSELLG